MVVNTVVNGGTWGEPFEQTLYKHLKKSLLFTWEKKLCNEIKGISVDFFLLSLKESNFKSFS